jgi:hypothetical protein
VTFRTYCRKGSDAYWTNIAAYQGDTLASAEKIAFSTVNDANYAALLPLDVVQGTTYRLVGMINSTNAPAAFGTFTLRWDDEFPTTLPLPVFRPAEQGGGMSFTGSGAGRSLTFYLEDTLPTAYYAVFTNGTLQGPFFAAAKGVKGAGLLELPVDAKESSKFFAIGVSDKPISVGDPLVPGANAGN